MADFSDLLTPAAVVAGVTANARRPLVTLAAAAVAAGHGLDRAAIAAALAAREALGSTGFGGGVAIPHARLAGLDRPVGGVVRLDRAIPFGAPDGIPVDLAFALLSPTHADSAHLKLLARVSRTLRDAAFVAKLRGSGSADALYALMAGDDHG